MEKQQTLENKVDIFAYMKETAKEVDFHTLSYLKDSEESVNHLANLRCGLKRGKPKILPTLGRLSFEVVCKEDWKRLVPILSAFELGTSSCYVMDDVLDNQQMREGDLSTFRKYGLNKAIIASTIQQLLSNEILLNARMNGENREEVLRLWNETLKNIYLGQNRNEDTKGKVDLGTYLKRCYSIAGVVAEKIFEICSVIGKASENEKETLKNFGRNYGIACQIRNDFMDLIPQNVIGNRSQSLSRDSYEDVRKGILTYPLIHAMNNGHRKEIVDILSQKNEKRFPRLTEILIKSGAMTETINLIDHYKEISIDSTKSLRDCEARSYMVALAQLLGNSKRYSEGFLEKYKIGDTQ